jgi:hypothetical protein
LDLTASGTVTIRLSFGLAEISGTVIAVDGNPVSNAEISLISDKESTRGVFTSHVADENGRFRIGDLVPGRFKLYAWDGVELGAAESPEFRRRFDSKATSIELAGYEHATVQLTVIAVE